MVLSRQPTAVGKEAMGPSHRPLWGVGRTDRAGRVGPSAVVPWTNRGVDRDAGESEIRHRVHGGVRGGIQGGIQGGDARLNDVRGAFTLIDVLVSVAVIGLLIGILLPSFAMVRESARRVMCASNLRQVGIGLHMYSQDSSELLPPSVFLPQSWRPGGGYSMNYARPELMDTVRTAADDFADRPWGQWDGLGLLFATGQLSAPGVFYCPSHPGSHPLSRYEGSWNASDGEIISNYQFRGGGPDGQRRLYRIDPNAALVTDMLRSFDDLNHAGGFNLLQAGLAVSWFEDEGQQIAGLMLRGGEDNGGSNAAEVVTDAWFQLDAPGSGFGSPSGRPRD